MKEKCNEKFIFIIFSFLRKKGEILIKITFFIFQISLVNLVRMLGLRDIEFLSEFIEIVR